MGRSILAAGGQLPRMKKSTLLVIVSILIVAVDYTSASEFIRVCYFPSWSYSRASVVARYVVEDIDPFLCTHLIYAFGALDAATKKIVPYEADKEEGAAGMYSRFTKLKSKNAALKTLLSIGGEHIKDPQFQTISNNDNVLQTFSTSTVQFLRSHNFDGLDVDWEFPSATSKNMFTNLLKSLKDAFNADTATPKLLLTFAASAGLWTIEPGYNIPEVAKYVDYANIMTYDYTQAGAQLLAFNSPLYSNPSPLFHPSLSTNWSINYWNSQGMPFNKIVVGVTAVGRRLVLQDRSKSTPGSPGSSQVRTGKYYSIYGGLAYPEICEFLDNPATVRTFYDPQKVPYLVNGDDWVGYEDKESLGHKLTWMKALGVAGIMFWEITQDDFSGKWCKDGKYPMLSFIKSSGSTGTAQPQPGEGQQPPSGTGEIVTTSPPQGNGSPTVEAYRCVLATLLTCLSLALLHF